MSADLTQGKLLPAIWRYTLPIVLTGLLQLLFNAADLVVVGQACGSISVAAVGATTAIINLLVNLFIGVSVGAGVTVAHAIGAGHDSDVRKTVHTSIPAALVSGAFLTVVGVICSRQFLAWMATPDDVIGLSAVYMRIYFCGTLPSMLYNFGAAILRAAGATKGPLIYLSAAGVINVVLNLFFVIVLHMDVAGVALATILSQGVSAVLVLRALMRRTDACRLNLREIRFHRVQLMKIIRIGLPAGIQNSLFSISNVLIQSSVNSFSSVAMSGNAAAQNLEGFVYITMNSFHQTALNFTGQNYGSGKFDRMAKIERICLASVCLVGIGLGVLMVLFARPLLHIYLTDSEEAVGYGITRLIYICLPYFLCGLMDVTTGLIRGMGSSVPPMLICVLGVCGLRILWIYTIFRMPQYHTLPGLYLSYTVSWLVTFLCELAVYHLLYARAKRSFHVKTEDVFL